MQANECGENHLDIDFPLLKPVAGVRTIRFVSWPTKGTKIRTATSPSASFKWSEFAFRSAKKPLGRDLCVSGRYFRGAKGECIMTE